MDKFEGALGKGKGRKLYAYKVMMMKVRKQECILQICDVAKSQSLCLIDFMLLHFIVRNGSSFNEISIISRPPVFPGSGK